MDSASSDTSLRKAMTRMVRTPEDKPMEPTVAWKYLFCEFLGAFLGDLLVVL